MNKFEIGEHVSTPKGIGCIEIVHQTNTMLQYAVRLAYNNRIYWFDVNQVTKCGS